MIILIALDYFLEGTAHYLIRTVGVTLAGLTFILAVHGPKLHIIYQNKENGSGLLVSTALSKTSEHKPSSPSHTAARSPSATSQVQSRPAQRSGTITGNAPVAGPSAAERMMASSDALVLELVSMWQEAALPLPQKYLEAVRAINNRRSGVATVGATAHARSSIAAAHNQSPRVRLGQGSTWTMLQVSPPVSPDHNPTTPAVAFSVSTLAPLASTPDPAATAAISASTAASASASASARAVSPTAAGSSVGVVDPTRVVVSVGSPVRSSVGLVWSRSRGRRDGGQRRTTPRLQTGQPQATQLQGGRQNEIVAAASR